MPEPIDLEKIGEENPHLNIEKIKESCESRKFRRVEGRGYSLAMPSERRRAIIGHLPEHDPRTVRLRSSLIPTK
jgi:hypothetical protein